MQPINLFKNVWMWFKEQVVLYTIVYPYMWEQARLQEYGRKLAIIEKAKQEELKCKKHKNQ